MRESERTSAYITMITRLPTFTRTPLPPLPLTTPTSPPVANVAEVAPVSVVNHIPQSGPTLPAPEVTPHLAEPEVTVVYVPPTSANPLTTNPDPLTTATALPVSSTNLPTNGPLSTSTSTSLPPATVITLPSPTASATGVVVTQAPPPTNPATVIPTQPASATGTTAPSPTAPSTTAPTAIPTATPTVTAAPQEWAFNGVQLYTDQYEGGLLLYGNVTNNTGTTQELLSIGGDFYDAQGQVIASPEDGFAYWPGTVLPAGESMPFELIVEDAQNVANFELNTAAEPSSETPRQDFDFAEVNQWTEAETYCVEGNLHNPAGELDEYLVIALILYDTQDRVINFSDYGEFGSGVGQDGQSFEICIDPPNQGVARYELQAWGR